MKFVKFGAWAMHGQVHFTHDMCKEVACTCQVHKLVLFSSAPPPFSGGVGV